MLIKNYLKPKFKIKEVKNKSPRFLAVLGLIFSGVGFFIIASLAFIALSTIALFITLAIFLILLTILTGENYFVNNGDTGSGQGHVGHTIPCSVEFAFIGDD